MEKVTINGKEYQLDVDKCKEQGLLVEGVNYPKDWDEFVRMNKNQWLPGDKTIYKPKNYLNLVEDNAIYALEKLIVLRNWWWDNMCDGWRPEWKGEKGVKFTITVYNEDITKEEMRYYNTILAFPSAEIRDEFYEVYKDLIKEAKMLL